MAISLYQAYELQLKSMSSEISHLKKELDATRSDLSQHHSEVLRNPNVCLGITASTALNNL